MDSGDQSAHITKREFSIALTLVWTFIMLAFTPMVLSGSSSPSRSYVVYWAISLLMAMKYAVASWRGGVSGKRVVVAVVLAGVALFIGVVAYFVGG
jgi:hypothetical protein